MLITRETDYALRLLRALSGGERRTAGALCSAELVPQQFGYKILKKLNKAGLVSITRGVDGGCLLAKPLETITLYDTMSAMDADTAVSACTDPDFPCLRRQTKGCTLHPRLCAIQRTLDDELKSHTLAALFAEAT